MKTLSNIFIFSLLIYLSIYQLVFVNYGEIWQYIINPLILIFFSFVAYFIFGKDEVKYHKYKNEIVSNIVISSLLYLIIYYTFGLVVGYSKNPYVINIEGFIINSFSILLVILLKEYIRTIFINKVSFIIIFLVFLISDLHVIDLIKQIATVKDIFNIFGEYILPAISINLFCIYICKKTGYVGLLLYRTIIVLPTFTIKIVPNYDWIINTLFNIVFPLFTYLFIQYMIDKREKSVNKRQIKEFNPKRWLVTFTLTIVLVLFGIGAFPYKPIIILTGSMQPAINPGDMLIITDVDIKKLKVGDVIQYKKNDYFVVHRIVSILYDDKDIKLVLKGDNNKDIDSSYVKKEEIIGKMQYKIPYAGYPTYLIKKIFSKDRNVDIETGD